MTKFFPSNKLSEWRERWRSYFKVDELLRILNSKNAQVNAITNSNIEEVDFIAHNPYNTALKSQNYEWNFQKQYSNPAGALDNNNFNNYDGANHGNLLVENSFKTFMQAQIDQNNVLIKITEKHDNIIGKLCN